MKTFKKVALSVVCVILVLAVVVTGVLGFYFPRYLNKKEVAEIKIENTDEITMMSCNLRCLTPLDFGKKSWFYRAELVMEGIKTNAPGIIGFQEATKWQYNYLVDCLEGYDSVITYRDNSIIAEGCPVFYNTALYTLVDKGSFWLSETPEEMSKDWGAACYRICSYVILTEKATDKQFVVFNTHLDHISDEARIKGVGVILDKIKQFGSYPSVIMGDFNAEEGTETYIKVTENFLDVRYETENTDDAITYQDWGQTGLQLDYFMISKTGFEVLSYDVVDELYGGNYSADHFPIVLKTKLN
ncbi:MAG: endonuclease/exonuclease/phosphatase family protein [Clostridia bacterium]|nr:endonuclease/exonuclease/phosphatase family protein [Clostridia bacterium]